MLQDDWYEGMFLPKNSTVWLAAWAIHQNEDEYPDHDRFNPDRFKNHTKLAYDYAVGPDWANRDEYSLALTKLSALLTAVYITMATDQGAECVRAFISLKEVCGVSRRSYCGRLVFRNFRQAAGYQCLHVFKSGKTVGIRGRRQSKE